MTHRNRPTLALLACLVAATSLAACTKGSPEAGQPNTAQPSTSSAAANTPTGTPLGSPSSSPPSATPTGPPARPATATGLSLAAGEAFVRHYIDLMNYASQTGDGAPLMAASDAGCEGCKQYADFAAKINAANGGLSGDYLERVVQVNQLVRGTTGHLRGSADVTVGEYTSKGSPSAKPEISKAAKYTEQVALSASKGNWVMFEIELEER